MSHLREVLDALIGMTASSASEGPSERLWTPFLRLTLAQFAESGGALLISLPGLGVWVWATGPEPMAPLVSRGLAGRPDAAGGSPGRARPGVDDGRAPLDALDGKIVIWGPAA